jgi:hypothetical protein
MQASWATSNPDVALVDPLNGQIEAFAPGDALITVRSGGAAADISISVTASLSSLRALTDRAYRDGGMWQHEIATALLSKLAEAAARNTGALDGYIALRATRQACHDEVGGSSDCQCRVVNSLSGSKRELCGASLLRRARSIRRQRTRSSGDFRKRREQVLIERRGKQTSLRGELHEQGVVDRCVRIYRTSQRRRPQPAQVSLRDTCRRHAPPQSRGDRAALPCGCPRPGRALPAARHLRAPQP